jgi:hypothetical protein
VSVISTFQTPFKVAVLIDEMEAFFDGTSPVSGIATVVAVRFKAAGWFTNPETKFLVVLEKGKVGWVDVKYCSVVSTDNLPSRR